MGIKILNTLKSNHGQRKTTQLVVYNNYVLFCTILSLCAVFNIHSFGRSGDDTFKLIIRHYEERQKVDFLLDTKHNLVFQRSSS